MNTAFAGFLLVGNEWQGEAAKRAKMLFFFGSELAAKLGRISLRLLPKVLAAENVARPHYRHRGQFTTLFGRFVAFFVFFIVVYQRHPKLPRS